MDSLCLNVGNITCNFKQASSNNYYVENEANINIMCKTVIMHNRFMWETTYVFKISSNNSGLVSHQHFFIPTSSCGEPNPVLDLSLHPYFHVQNQLIYLHQLLFFNLLIANSSNNLNMAIICMACQYVT